jgi:hypothetical protein
LTNTLVMYELNNDECRRMQSTTTAAGGAATLHYKEGVPHLRLRYLLALHSATFLDVEGQLSRGAAGAPTNITGMLITLRC